MPDEFNLLKDADLLLKNRKISEAAVIYQSLGDVFVGQFSYQKALAMYSKAYHLSKNFNCLNAISSLYIQLQKYFCAYDIYTSWIEKKITFKSLLKTLLFSLTSKCTIMSFNQENTLAPSVVLSAEETIEALEKKLNISIDEKGGNPFHIQSSVDSLSMENRYDLALAYTEMGFFEDALALLAEILKKEDLAFTFKIKCIELFSFCNIQRKNYLEAILCLEKTIDNSGAALLTDTRLSLIYLLALAFEKSGNIPKALFYLRKIEKDNRKYRDIDDKIRILRQKL